MPNSQGKPVEDNEARNCFAIVHTVEARKCSFAVALQRLFSAKPDPAERK
jgi:hypothetical protein